MGVLVIADRFCAAQGSSAVESFVDGWRARAADVDVHVLPAALAGCENRWAGALGGSVARHLGHDVVRAELDGRQTALVSAADLTSSAPIGRLIRELSRVGVKQVILELGESDIPDRGLGAWAALRGQDTARFEGPDFDAATALASDFGGLGGGLGAVVEGTDVTLWTPRSTPFFTPGAAAAPLLGSAAAGARMPGTRASSSVAREHSAKLRIAQGIDAQCPDALTQRVIGAPSGGCAGGMAALLAAAGADLVPIPQGAGAMLGVPALIESAHLVTYLCRTFDWRDLRDSTLEHLCETASVTATPVIVATGASAVGRRECASLGVASMYAATTQIVEPGGPGGPMLAETIEDESWRALGSRIARTWIRTAG